MSFENACCIYLGVTAFYKGWRRGGISTYFFFSDFSYLLLFLFSCGAHILWETVFASACLVSFVFWVLLFPWRAFYSAGTLFERFFDEADMHLTNLMIVRASTAVY